MNYTHKGFTTSRKQRLVIKKIEKFLEQKIIPMMEDAELPPFTIEQYCCPIHNIEISFTKVEHTTQEEYDELLDDIHKAQGVH